MHYIKVARSGCIMKLLFVLTLSFSLAITSYVPREGMIGPGKFLVVHIKKCPDDEQYLFQFDISRRKVNRTHDGFSGEIRIETPLDKSYGVRIEICKHMDGGCKPYQSVTDNSFCNFVEKYAKKNAESLFQASGIPLPICPIPVGNHKISNFLFDYNELPENNVYGMYEAHCYVIDQEGAAVGCVDFTVRFDSADDDD